MRGSLGSESFADEDWGFLAQQTLEKLLQAVLVLNAQEPPRTHSLQALDDFAVVARYDADPTPLPADRARLLDLLDALHQELRRRVGLEARTSG